MPRARDTQRAKAYRAEGAACIPGKRFYGIAGCQAYLDQVLASRWVRARWGNRHISVTHSNSMGGASAHVYFDQITVGSPNKGVQDLILHELAASSRWKRRRRRSWGVGRSEDQVSGQGLRAAPGAAVALVRRGRVGPGRRIQGPVSEQLEPAEPIPGIFVDPEAQRLTVLGQQMVVGCAYRFPAHTDYRGKDWDEHWAFTLLCGENGWWVALSIWPVDGDCQAELCDKKGNQEFNATAEKVLAVWLEGCSKSTPPELDEYDDPYYGLEPGTWVWEHPPLTPEREQQVQDFMGDYRQWRETGEWPSKG